LYKIIFVHLHNDFSGSPVVLLSVIKAFELRLKGSIGLYVGSSVRGVLDCTSIPKTNYGYRLYKNKLLRLWCYLLSQIFLLCKLALDPKINRNTIIYVNTVLPVGAMFYGWLTNKKVICHVHELPFASSKIYKLLFKLTFYFANKIIVVSTYQRDQLANYGKTMITIPNCLADTQPKTASVKKRNTHKKMNILFVGSLRKYKGIDQFVSLANEFCDDERFEFRMVLNGEKYEIKNYIASHHHLENLSIQGPCSKMESNYIWSDLVVNFSLPGQWVETFGLTLLEGMQFGRPVIAPLIGGHTDFVKDGINGFLIDASDIHGLKKALNDMQLNNKLYFGLAKEAKKTAALFEFDKFSKKIYHLSRDLRI
jgi:L-malate glycosyltransferase